jgi:hypothetical protein
MENIPTDAHKELVRQIHDTERDPAATLDTLVKKLIAAADIDWKSIKEYEKRRCGNTWDDIRKHWHWHVIKRFVTTGRFRVGGEQPAS